MKRSLFLSLALTLGLASAAPTAWANNAQVSAVTLTGQTPGASPAYTNIQFNLAWENSWRDAGAPSPTANWDAVWVFAKISDSPGLWKHATLSPIAADHNGQGFTVTPSPDGKGVFIYRSAQGAGAVNLANVQLRWNYGNDVVGNGANVTVRVFAVEMVYVPQGGFSVGDGTTANIQGQFIQAGTTSPFQITSEAALTLGGTSATNLSSQTGAFDDFTAAQTRTLPDVFPKGFNAFYCMKYECSQQQYVDFLNTLTPTQSAANTSGIQTSRSGEITGTHPNFVAPRPDRAVFSNGGGGPLRYMDWAALRPMSELEYEKACRGPVPAVPNEYPWGDATIQPAITLSGNENGTETITTIGANCNFNNQTFVNGDGGNGTLRVGIFAKAGNGRSNSGASYYGVMDMGGSTNEPCVYINSASNRTFTNATHGDGNLTASGGSDFAGTWALGYRGGYYANGQNEIRTSSRANQSTTASARAVRTAP